MKFLAILAIFFTAVSAAPLIDVDADVNADVDVDLGRGFNRKGGDGNNEFGNSQSCGGTDSGNGDDDDSSRNVCPGRLYSEPQCCVTNTANVLDLDCRARKLFAFSSASDQSKGCI